MKVYLKKRKDTKEKAIKNIEKSDKARSSYYKMISNQEWKDVNHYDLTIDSSIGAELCAEIICDYIRSSKK